MVRKTRRRAQIAKLNVADRYQVICVAPSLSSEPWYADHDQNPNKRDETSYENGYAIH